MKKLIMTLLFLGFAATSLAATVGSPELNIPAEPGYSSQEEEDPFKADPYLLYLEQKQKKEGHYIDKDILNLKTSLEMEFISERKLSTSSEVTNAKMEGQVYMFKIANNIQNIFEPYVKLGLSELKVKWTQNSNSVSVETNSGFVWGAGVKAKIWELKDYKVKLTLDGQYRKYDLDINESRLGGSSSIASAKNEVFEIEEWQTSLLVSKKLVLPVGTKDYYIAPYTGLTFSSINVDVYFQQSTSGADYSTYHANDKDQVGVVLGCDIMQSRSSRSSLNLEVRLRNETAFTLGGTMRF